MAVDNKTRAAADMAAATDLEEYTHREGDKTTNRCRTHDSPQEGCRTRLIRKIIPERGGRTTNAVVNEDNANNNGKIIARGNSNNIPTEYHLGTAKITRGHSNSNPTDPAHCPLIFHIVIHTDTL